MATPKIIPRVNGGGSLGDAIYGWGAGFITNTTTSSATEGGNLTLAANDDAAMAETHRLGVIEFKGAEDGGGTLTTGARIQSVTQFDAWSDTSNQAKLSFYTSYGNAQISEKVNIGGSTAMSVFNDYAAVAFEEQIPAVAGERFGGEILRYNPGGNIEGPNPCQIHFLHTDGTWDLTDAEAVATGGSQLLCLPGGGEGGDFLIRGFVRVPTGEILHTPVGGAVDGLPVYVSSTNTSGGEAGHFDFTAPSASGDYVRIVGYAIDDDSGDVLVYFDPDKTFVEIT